MNRDLEETLSVLGSDYRDVVERVRAAYAPADARDWRGTAATHAGRVARWTAAYLVAASLAVCVGLAVAFRGGETSPRVYTAGITDAKTVYTLAYREGAAATEAILASQKPDGSWSNDFLTRQNAAALRGVPSAAVAYKRAVRYLRSKGLDPLSSGELKVRGDRAARMLDAET